MKKESERFINKAALALDRGNWLLAVQFLRKVLAADPRHLPAYHELADIYLHLGHFEAAFEVVQRAVEHYPADYQSSFILANIFLVQNKPDDALCIYRRLGKARLPEQEVADLFFNMALAYHAKNQMALALRCLGQAIDEDNEYVEAYELTGKILFERKDRKGAKQAFERVLELEPKNLNAHHMLGIIHSKESKWEEAIKEWEMVLSFAPETDEAMRELGWAFNMIGQEEKAVHYLRKALDINPQNIQARIDLGAVFMGKMQFKEAIAEWECVREYDPHNKLIRKFLSQARLYEKRARQEKRGKRQKK